MNKEQRYILRNFYSLAKDMPEEYVDVLINVMCDVFKEIAKREFPNEWTDFETTNYIN